MHRDTGSVTLIILIVIVSLFHMLLGFYRSYLYFSKYSLLEFHHVQARIYAISALERAKRDGSLLPIVSDTSPCTQYFFSHCLSSFQYISLRNGSVYLAKDSKFIYSWGASAHASVLMKAEDMN